MRTCYLAGPMRGIPQYNFPAFFEAEDVLRKLKWEVLSPARMDVAAGEECDGKLGVNQISDDQTTRRIVRRDVEAIMSLRRENGDCIVVLPGWENSVGAFGEMALARWLHLPVLSFPPSYDKKKRTISLTLLEYDVHLRQWRKER